MSELNPVRIAVIGAGAMGRNHIRFVTEEPEAELVAIADAFEGARATAEAAGVVTARAAGVTYDVQAIPKTSAESLNDNA